MQPNSMNMQAWVFQTPHFLQQSDHGPVMYVDFSSLFFFVIDTVCILLNEAEQLMRNQLIYFLIK